METAIGLTFLGMFLAVWGVFLNKQTTRVLERMDERSLKQTEILEKMDERSVRHDEVLVGISETLAGVGKTLESIAQLIITGQRGN